VLQGEIEIKVINRDSTFKVRTGQTAQWTSTDKIKVFTDPNFDASITWRDSVFRFIDVPVVEVVRKIERRYDVQIIYQADSNSKPNFTGKLLITQKIEYVLGIIRDQCGGTFTVNPTKR
jgi:hypothetical protein